MTSIANKVSVSVPLVLQGTGSEPTFRPKRNIDLTSQHEIRLANTKSPYVAGILKVFESSPAAFIDNQLKKQINFIPATELS